jgi:hypothetical protein
MTLFPAHVAHVESQSVPGNALILVRVPPSIATWYLHFDHAVINIKGLYCWQLGYLELKPPLGMNKGLKVQNFGIFGVHQQPSTRNCFVAFRYAGLEQKAAKRPRNNLR